MFAYLRVIICCLLIFLNKVVLGTNNFIKIDLALESAYLVTGGNYVTISINLKNQNGTLATGIKIRDILPKELRVTEIVVSHGTYVHSPEELIWSIEELQANIPEASMVVKGVLSDQKDFKVNKAEIYQTFEEDIDSTPGNQNFCEDDISWSIIGGESIICFEDKIPIEITAAPGFNYYHWYRDGQLISGEISDKIQTNEKGKYSYIAFYKGSNGDCSFSPTAFVIVNKTSSFNFQSIISNPKCSLASGSIKVGNIEGEGAPFLYSLNNESYTVQNEFKNLVAGNYTVSVKDSNGCTSKKTVTLDSTNSTLSVIADVKCDSILGKARIKLFVSGGTAPYFYSDGSGFETTNEFVKSNGQHEFGVRDSQGCSTVHQAISNCQFVCLDTTISLCPRSTIFQEIYAPAGLSEYQWYRNDTIISGAVFQKYTISSLGKYTFKAKQQNVNIKGCDFNVVKSDSIEFSVKIKNETCSELPNGSIIIQNTKGFAPFLFSVKNGIFQKSPIFENLNSGNYTVILRDSLGCEKKLNNQIILEDRPNPPIINSDKTYICASEKATLFASPCEGGEIIWSNNEKKVPSVKVGPGIYSAKCSNTCGTSNSSNSIQILQFEEKPPFISISRFISCEGEEAILTANGCNKELEWNTGEKSNKISVKKSGTYTVRCFNICENIQQSVTVQIGVLPELIAPIVKANALTLAGSETATLFASKCHTGNLKWSTGDTRDTIKVGVGVYYALCTNQCGESKKSNQIEITFKSSKLKPVISSTKSVICNSDSLTLQAIGCGDNTVLWSNGQTGQSIIIRPSLSSAYLAVCKDGNGLYSEKSNELFIEVLNPQKPVLSCVNKQVCEGEDILIESANCFGEVVWSTGQKGQSIWIKVKEKSYYTAICQEGLCQSEVSDTLCVSISSPSPPFIYCEKNSYCVGDTVRLFSKDCSLNVLWSNGQSGNLINFIIDKAGDYQYHAWCESEEGICSSNISNTLKIHVGKAPAAPIVTSNLVNICPFKTVNLSQAILSKSLSLGSSIEFHSSPSINSPHINAPNGVSEGRYYLFEKNKEGCISSPSSVSVKIDSCTQNIDIEIKKIADTNRVVLNGLVSYYITVRNLGDITASNLIIRDSIPAGLKIFLISPDATFQNNTLFVHIPTLKPKETKVVIYQARVISEGKITNTASIWKVDQIDSKEDNNYSSFSINEDLPSYKIGLSKELVSCKESSENVFNLSFKFKIVNMGNLKIPNIQLSDDLKACFDSTVAIKKVVVEKIYGSNISLNPDYTGVLPHTYLMLDSLSNLNIKDSVGLILNVEIDLRNSEKSLFYNSAKVFSTSDTRIYDFSNEGSNPDPDSNGDPQDNEVFTKVELNDKVLSSGIIASLGVVNTTAVDENTCKVDYMILVQNRTKDTLSQVLVINNLQSFYTTQALYGVIKRPIVSSLSLLKLNPDFDGKINPQLTNEQSLLKPLATDTLFFSIYIKHNQFLGPYINQIYVTSRNNKGQIFSDFSNSGIEPSLWLNDTTIFYIPEEYIDFKRLISIPAGFSPNSDGMNDTFKIQLMNGAKLESVLIYNRWGSKVFESVGNDIEMELAGWNGKVNRADVTYSNPVPNGTYYYQIKLKNIQVPFLGFITIVR